MRPCSAWVHGDIFTKLSFLIWGLGYIGHGQLIKALLVTVVQGLGLYFLGTSGVPALKKFGTLGTVQMEMQFNPLTLKNEVNDYDNSFAILLLSVIAMLVIVSLFILIAVAFTNYDQQHMPPASSSAKEVDLLVTSFSTDRGINFRRFFPVGYTLDNYINILFHSDSVAQFPRWFMNIFVVACFNCVISTCFVLMVAYALSCCRFKGRKLLQNLSVIVNLFPGVLAMIAVYFVLKYLNLTNSYAGLIMVYAGSSGLGYLICKGFFDTIPVSLREAAKLDGLFLGLKKADKIPHGLVQIACFFGAHEPSPADQRRPIRAEKRCQAEVVRVLVVLREEAEEVSKPLSGQLKRDIYIADIHPLGHFCAEMLLPPCVQKLLRPVVGLVGDAGRSQKLGFGHGLPCNEIARVAANAGLLHRAFVVATQDGDVDLAVEDLAEQQIALLGHDGEPDVRMPQVIPHQQLGKFGLAEGVRRTDDDVLVCFALHGVQMGAERIHERKIRPGLFGQKFSLWGKFQPFGAAIDDGDAEFFLHVLEPLGQRGLCHEQLGRHAGQIRRLRKLVQNLPIRIFHCASLRSFLCSV